MIRQLVSLSSQKALVNKLSNEYKNLGHNTEAAKKKLMEIHHADNVFKQMMGSVTHACRPS